MMMTKYVVCLAVTIATIASPALGGFLVQTPDDPYMIQEECVRSNCTASPLCYIPHPTNCMKFIMCKPLPTGSYYSQVMPCAFGTIWKRGRETACDRHDLVECRNDPCRNSSLESFGHSDGNCRTFWKCHKNRLTPACCPMYKRYDPVTDKCVNDITCQDLCPLRNDATCRGPGVKSVNFPDENCKTYWDCEKGHPHPVCCPDGEGYDPFTSSCVKDASCVDTCPPEYGDICSKRGVSSYDLVDGNCRTYMKCNANGLDDPFCCPSGKMYNTTTKTCIPAEDRDCYNARCPYGYLEECRLEPVPNMPHMYKNLDSYGGWVMPCPVGTVFIHSKCQCGLDTAVKGPAALGAKAGCTMAIHAKMPGLKNHGTAVAALLMIGDYGQGEKGYGNMTSFWDGNDGINIPYYGSQSLSSFYLEMMITPTSTSPHRQILLSSCNYINGQPSLELSLFQFSGQTGAFQLRVRNSRSIQPLEIDVPYDLNTAYRYRVMYDSKRLGLFLDTIPPSPNAVRQIQNFGGQIPIDISGLRFGHCRYERNVSSFIGYVTEIKFSKCLTPEMKEDLNQGQSPPVVV